jgi:hypothetical protein
MCMALRIGPQFPADATRSPGVAGNCGCDRSRLAGCPSDNPQDPTQRSTEPKRAATVVEPGSRRVVALDQRVVSGSASP